MINIMVIFYPLQNIVLSTIFMFLLFHLYVKQSNMFFSTSILLYCLFNKCENNFEKKHPKTYTILHLLYLLNLIIIN